MDDRTVASEPLSTRIAAIRRRIAEAAHRVGRDPASIELIGASKTVSPAVLREAVDGGLKLFGENRVQEAQGKIPEVPGAHWHFIGHLQRNKAAKALELFEMIQSLGSLRLAEVLDRLGADRGIPVPVLVEINLEGEASKDGFSPERLPGLFQALDRMPGLRVLGLMTIPPPVDEPEQSRPFFRRLQDLSCQIRDLGLERIEMRHLSMGMSTDFEVAVEEGATMVRVGTALFGPR